MRNLRSEPPPKQAAGRPRFGENFSGQGGDSLSANGRRLVAPDAPLDPQGDRARSRREARLMREQQQRKRLRTLLIVAGLVAFILLVGLGYMVVRSVWLSSGADDRDADAARLNTDTSQTVAPTAEELRLRDAVASGAAVDDPNVAYLPTPLIAEYGGLKIHSPISANHITEIEFHQASYNTALPLTPLVNIVDAQEVADRHGTKHAPLETQPFGENPLIAEAVSTWRLNSVGPEMSSVDVGSVAETDVYAPISGTVVKIKSYSLFGLIDDYEVHIQSPGHPGLDVVMLHIDDLSVKVGDVVRGGATRVARVRDIGSVIDNNLSNFTAPGDPGNHCHVQVNDATHEEYKGLEDALNIFPRQT
jgi:biotin carboxyl carrier protein